MNGSVSAFGMNEVVVGPLDDSGAGGKVLQSIDVKLDQNGDECLSRVIMSMKRHRKPSRRKLASEGPKVAILCKQWNHVAD